MAEKVRLEVSDFVGGAGLAMMVTRERFDEVKRILEEAKRKTSNCTKKLDNVKIEGSRGEP